MNNLSSLFFYLCVFLLAGITLHIGVKRKSKFFIVIALTIPVCIAGLRVNVGTDYATYLDNISTLKGVSIGQYADSFMSFLEPSFYVIASVANNFNTPSILFFVYSAVSIIFFYKSLKLSRIKHAALVYVLMLLVMFPMSFNLVRQFAAISVALYATIRLIQNKRGYFILTVTASLIHASAVINLIAYVVFKFMNNKRRTISANKLIIATIVLSVTIGLISYGLQKYGYLIEKDNVNANLNFIPRLLMLMIIYSLWYTARSVFVDNKILIRLATLSVALGAIGFIVPYGDRIALYFLPFIIMLFPTAIFYLMPRYKKHYTVPVVVLVGIIYFVVSYYLLGSHAIFPYRYTT